MGENKEGFYLGNEGLPTVDATFNWTPEMVAELDACRKSILQFSKHFTIVNLDEGKIKISLRGYQKRILKALAKNRLVAVLSSRQSGKTTLMTIYALWIVCFKPDQKILIIANKEKTAISIFQRVRMAYEKLPNYLKPGVATYGKTGMSLGNGSGIGISTTSSDAARGEAINCLIIDEAAFIPEHIMEEFWKSVYPVISSSKNGKIFMVSTANGSGNLFYRIYTDAMTSKDSTWHAERVDYHEIPGRDEEWKQRTIKDMGSKEAFDQEFGNVFIETGQAAIDADLLESLKVNAKDPVLLSDDGKYKVFEEFQDGHIYTIGVDVGEGINQASSVIQILDITNLSDIRQSGVFADNMLDPYHFAVKLNDIAKSWGSPPLLIERNGPGGQVIDAMQHTHQYEHIVTYTPSAGKQSAANNRMGIFSHTNTKFTGVSNMRYWLNTLRVLKIWDMHTISEFETYIRHPNGMWKKRSGENVWDDRVESLMWALMMLDIAIAQKYYEVALIDSQGKPKKLTNPVYYTPPVSPRENMRYAGPKDNNALPTFMPVSNQYDELAELQMDGWTPMRHG